MKVDIYRTPINEPAALQQVAIMRSTHNKEMPVFDVTGRYFLGTITNKELRQGYKLIAKHVSI